MPQPRLKELQTRERDLVDELNALKTKNSDTSRQINRKQEELDTVQGQIRRLTATLRVSEHAVMRRMEQKLGTSVEEIEKEILMEGRLQELVQQLGGGKYPLGDGSKAVVKQGVVVTVIPGDK